MKSAVIASVIAASVAITTAFAANASSGTAAASGLGCSPSGVRGAVRAFVSLKNGGLSATAAARFAAEPAFQWYSAEQPDSRLGAKSKDRRTLASYFARRAAQHERLTLATLTGGGYDRRTRMFNFGGKLSRAADDIRGTVTLRDFKGSAVCVQGHPRFIVWSI